MAPRKRASIGKRPSMQWDGHLYRPQTFGSGGKAGTVDWAKQQRLAREHRDRVQREFDRFDSKKQQPVRWYLTSWPFLFVAPIMRWIGRRWR